MREITILFCILCCFFVLFLISFLFSDSLLGLIFVLGKIRIKSEKNSFRFLFWPYSAIVTSDCDRLVDIWSIVERSAMAAERIVIRHEGRGGQV